MLRIDLQQLRIRTVSAVVSKDCRCGTARCQSVSVTCGSPGPAAHDIISMALQVRYRSAQAAGSDHGRLAGG